MTLRKESADAADACMGMNDVVGAPLSVRHPWLRPGLLGTLTTLLALPWLTSTGCSGDAPPSTYSGFELLQSTLAHEPLFALAPLGLFLAALVGVAALHIKTPGRRLLALVGQLLVVVAGAFFTLLAVELPHAGDHVSHEFGTSSFLDRSTPIRLTIVATQRCPRG